MVIRWQPAVLPQCVLGQRHRSGWAAPSTAGSPCEDDAVYRLLVPLKPPRGHAFHLELGTPGEMPAKVSCVHMELECTCAREQLVENTLCFLHHPEGELRRNQDPSLLQTLCTDSYLDVQKTALWVQDSVSSAWVVVPPSHR
ncbi:unnamed protein product [Bubo scandiacus]